MNSLPSRKFDERPVLVLALGGNALSPPIAAADHYQRERAIVAQTGVAIAKLTRAQYRLVIVHGNGPQVGRLLQIDPDPDPNRSNLDIHIAQTQGELGYLLMSAIEEPTACLLTRALVDPELGPPVKPVGPILDDPPDDLTRVTKVSGGWRLIVPSPRPKKVLEADAIATLLRSHHVIAGGGGGVPLSTDGVPVSGVIDKDWIASLLAVTLDATHVVFATDVDHVYDHFGEPDARPLPRLSPNQAGQLLRTGTLGAGSMAPKVESALDFATTTGRTAHICALQDINAALSGAAGTTVG